MAHLSKNELEEIFLDVRKSYRLLYFYQRRILDTVNFIADTLTKNVISGYPLYSDGTPRPGGRINLDALAWDWLLMFGYEFCFQDETINNNHYQFAITVQSDSGYDDAYAGVSINSVEQFSPVEQSATKIYFYIGQNTWKPDVFGSAWTKDANSEFEYREDEQKLFLSKRFDLSDFSDEDSIMKHLHEVKEYFTAKGIKYL